MSEALLNHEENQIVDSHLLLNLQSRDDYIPRPESLNLTEKEINQINKKIEYLGKQYIIPSNLLQYVHSMATMTREFESVIYDIECCLEPDQRDLFDQVIYEYLNFNQSLFQGLNLLLERVVHYTQEK